MGERQGLAEAQNSFISSRIWLQVKNRFLVFTTAKLIPHELQELVHAGTYDSDPKMRAWVHFQVQPTQYPASCLKTMSILRTCYYLLLACLHFLYTAEFSGSFMRVQGDPSTRVELSLNQTEIAPQESGCFSSQGRGITCYLPA